MSNSCDLMDCSLPGSFVHGILQARYWSGLPFPSPGDLPDPVIGPGSLALQADSLPTELRGKPMTLGLKAMADYQWEQKYLNII